MAEGELITQDMAVSATALELLNRSEIDTQIATAHKFPRSVAMFQKEAAGMVALSAEVAQECFYMLRRKDKDGNTSDIIGPSARFAEIVASCWGNSRAGARVINEDARFVTAQGVFHDLQRNVAVTYEVRRRITTRNGKTYSDDMIGVTANAACAIALRNAVLKGIPKAFWVHAYETALKTAKGEAKTLPQRRDAALAAFKQMGFSEAEVCKVLGVRGNSDIDIDKLFELSGILTALQDGDTTKAELLKEIAPPKEAAPAAPPVTTAAPAVEQPAAPKTSKKAPAVEKPQQKQAQSDGAETEQKPAAEEVNSDDIRSPDEVLAELENVLSGITDPDEAREIFNRDYANHPALSFPGDMASAKNALARAIEAITA